MSTWVLLRGLTREQGHWGRFPAELAAALADTLPDTRPGTLPGAGVLHNQPCPWQVAAMVDACQRQLAAQGAVPPYHLLGLSLGGMVAAAWSRACPQEVASLVLVNTSLRPYSPLQRRLRAALWPRLLRLLASQDRPAIKRAVLQLTSRQPERHHPVLSDWLAIHQARPVRAATALRQLLAGARYRWVGPPPAMPVLVVCSASDGLVDPACSQRIAQAWQAELASHPTAGHDLALDDGPWLAARVAAWTAERMAERPADRPVERLAGQAKNPSA